MCSCLNTLLMHYNDFCGEAPFYTRWRRAGDEGNNTKAGASYSSGLYKKDILDSSSIGGSRLN